MFLPIGDTPNPPGRAWVNEGLIALNVAVYLLVSLPLSQTAPDFTNPWLIGYLHAIGVHSPHELQQVARHLSGYEAVVFQYGFKPAAPSALTLLSSLFLHGGLLHLAGNMLFLWIFGDNVEYRLGRLRYLLLYLGCGVAATLFFSLFAFHSSVPLVGASGAISGVLGCYFLWFPRNRVKTFVFLFPFIMQSFFLPARWVLGFYLVVDNLLPFLFTGGASSGVAHGAHIGGFAAGCGLAWAVDRLPGLRQTAKPFRERFSEQTRPLNDVTSVTALLEAERFNEASAGYFQLAAAQRLLVPSSQVLALGLYWLGRQEYELCLTVLRRFIVERPSDPLLPQACLAAGRALLKKRRCDLSAYQYFLTAAEQARDADVAQEARRYLQALEAQCHSRQRY
ncbi:MAG: rhomboid family intramembrane serine protease [Desulfuromonadaceae bacterium]|nr:rhomboid family intramembrane serine protease [Desulfuromonadaceae bacterium]